MQEKKDSSYLRASGKSTKLLPRDISDSFGKLPPQAIDLEELVLAALLVDKNAFGIIKDILLPEYFYSEAHREIFSAMKTLGEKGSPIDMMTVNRQLVKDGKDEIVGGAAYIAGLSLKAVSAASIEYHSTVVIEKYILRETILIGGKFHQLAYDDSADAIEILEQAVKDIQDLKDRTLKSSGPNKIKALWKDKLLTTEPDEPAPIIWIDGTPVAWPGAHSLLVGKKKSRKTLFVIWLIAQFLKGKSTDGNSVLIFDTEQSKRHVYRMRKKVHSMTGKTVNTFFLRGMSPEERRDFIFNTVQYWPIAPQLIIIDGIRDLMKDINSTDETTDVITWLEKLTLLERPDQTQLAHVINILHLNKGNNDARGHIGSELLNKAELTIELELDPKANCTNVRCESSREKPFHPFSFTHDDQELPVLAENTKAGVVTESETKNRLFLIFEDGMLGWAELLESVRAHFEIGEVKAKNLITRWNREGLIAKTGKAYSKDAKYKLLVTRDNALIPQPEQQEIFQPEPETLPGTEDLPF